MKTIIRENTWLNRLWMDFGWGNGYVLIPIGHPCHGMHYDEILVEVNGGLTYSELVNQDKVDFFGLDESDLGCWMVGFDTAHCDDTLEGWPKERVQEEADKLAEQLKNYKKG